ncbi:HEAT repeat domain-containing protein [Streptomyces violaceusniger]|uniref:HEAT repeat domain-containing protein n=1 Tax=Streptomyces violaceusniger TaxID=68280 RepID=UPI003830EB45
MAAEYQYNRMVLREEISRDVIVGLASKGLWPSLEDNENDESASYMYYRLWGVAQGLWASLTEDLTTQVKVFTVFGEDSADVVELSRRVTIILQPYSRQELTRPPQFGADKHERIRTAMRAALAAGDEYDGELYAVISAAAQAPDPDVRNAAAWATTYVSWPQVLELLRNMAANDSDARVREGAQALLNDFQRDEAGDQ